jgi:hypothetical protein
MQKKDVRDCHRVGNSRFELVGTRTASVRDQMLRATLLVQALWKRGQPKVSPGDWILILGGGAAGASAAMTASAYGVNSVIIEREPYLFSRQMGVTTRRLHPTEFDWPQPHTRTPWPQVGAYPSLPLPYSASEPASAAARRWEAAFAQAAERSRSDRGRGHIHEVLGADRDDILIQDEPYGCSASSPVVKLPHGQYRAVICCIGQGREKVFFPEGSVSSFAGPRFWSSDGLSEDLLQTIPVGSSTRQPVRALVSGGGDGAQQDVQRILCSAFGMELLENCVFRYLPSLRGKLAPLLGPMWDADIERHKELDGSSVDRARREKALRSWNEHYTRQARDVWSKLQSHEQRLLVGKLLRPEVLRQEVTLTWVQRDKDTTYCYPLNRFITELVIQSYALHRLQDPWPDATSVASSVLHDKPPVTLVGYELEAISGYNGHSCSPSEPHKCHGRRHAVRFKRFPNGIHAHEQNYDVIVIRHGIDADPCFRLGPAPDMEQLMPHGIE